MSLDVGRHCNYIPFTCKQYEGHGPAQVIQLKGTKAELELSSL